MTKDRAGASRGMPRWMKGLLISVLALFAIFILVHLLGGGFGHLTSHFGSGTPQSAHTDHAGRPQ